MKRIASSFLSPFLTTTADAFQYKQQTAPTPLAILPPPSLNDVIQKFDQLSDDFLKSRDERPSLPLPIMETEINGIPLAKLPSIRTIIPILREQVVIPQLVELFTPFREFPNSPKPGSTSIIICHATYAVIQELCVLMEHMTKAMSQITELNQVSLQWKFIPSEFKKEPVSVGFCTWFHEMFIDEASLSPNGMMILLLPLHHTHYESIRRIPNRDLCHCVRQISIDTPSHNDILSFINYIWSRLEDQYGDDRSVALQAKLEKLASFLKDRSIIEIQTILNRIRFHAHVQEIVHPNGDGKRTTSFIENEIDAVCQEGLHLYNGHEIQKTSRPPPASGMHDPMIGADTMADVNDDTRPLKRPRLTD